MTKAEAWDAVNTVVSDGVNCWQTEDDDIKKAFAYLTGMVEALDMAVKADEKKGKHREEHE